MKNADGIFQRAIDCILLEKIGKFSYAFIADLLHGFKESRAQKNF